MAEITELSIPELSAQLASRAVSVAEVSAAFLSHAETVNGQLGSFLTFADVAADSARAQSMLDSGTAGPLTGIPVGVKDNLSTEGIRTTCASKILENFVPPYDATVITRMKEAGMVILGKTNMDEFAMGTSNENSAYGVVRNPWDLARAPGGSSGGSAAAVAGGQVPLSLGSDTGGSIRQPASLCGVVGFKPTYGRVSRYGLVAFASSLDQVGPIGRTVEETAWLAQVISGPDENDATCLKDGKIHLDGLTSGSLKGKRFGIPKELFSHSAQPGVLAAVRAAMDTLAREGAEFVELSIPEIEQGVTTYYIIAPAEASSNLGRFDGVRYGVRLEGDGHEDMVAQTRGKLFGHEVKQRIMVGTYVLSAGYFDAFYVRAQQVRAKMAAGFESAFEGVDAILSPTSPCVAFKLGELSGDPLALKLLDYCTIPANMGGFPGISIPCGLSEGLPVGMQLMGPVNADEKLLNLAYLAEQVLGVQAKPPVLS